MAPGSLSSSWVRIYIPAVSRGIVAYIAEALIGTNNYFVDERDDVKQSLHGRKGNIAASIRTRCL
jgi:hypothetical protein